MKAKTEIDIEKLLHWAYRDELSKRRTSSAEGIWDKLRENGQRGGIDPGHGAAQRYSHFGLPDPDAEAIEKAVGELEDFVVDWSQSIEALAGELAGLVSINDLSRRPTGDPGKRTTAGWTDKRTGKWQQAENRPRDMLMVGSLRTKALVTMHAIRGNRPDWRDDPPAPYPVRADKGPNAKVVGKCEAKNRYSLGAYCPLQWDPSPISVITARAEYVAWWEGLARLAETLSLERFVVLPPQASAAPWQEEVREEGSVFRAPESGPMSVLPLAPMRERMLAPYRRRASGGQQSAE